MLNQDPRPETSESGLPQGHVAPAGNGGRRPSRSPRRTFVLFRKRDYSGVSGEGVIAEGVAFGDGTAVLHWLGAFPTTTVFQSVAQLVRIHGHGGSTFLVFDAIANVGTRGS